ncbi:transcriptional adapter 3 [Lingula anatina]|uniref:Transcriptional adapter 3 n=1 Tax=Lingula anatina TaxID=7574 RepID=A0A1S3IZX6_LINAN|nr:transcriptional adapter 3 [Lingula anatina]XP_013403751.1 transcriptional adapter 3 [Lingula anatina]XP_013403752.1 transcriptional adapter 3 [Lingula anatina]|eukprot:XP_013403750.1 transcriptional adapter 3 [Lingula anatina]
MKGKGKSGHSSGHIGGSGGEVLKDCPLQFPDLTPLDHTKYCPQYSTVLAKSDDATVGYGELDSLQPELETLLSSVAKRMRQLENEIQILVNWQEKGKDKKGGKFQQPPMPSPAGKRGKGGKGGGIPTSEERPSKKFKESSGKGSLVSTPGRPPKGKNIQAKMQEYEFVDSPLELPKLPRNDAPDRFWQSLEPYCCDITQEDLKVLEQILQSHEDDAEYYKVPTLGKHYSQKWAQEDLIEEQKEGVKITEPKRRGLSNLSNSTTPNTPEVHALLKKAESVELSEESSPFGPLTQRLVQALMEENIMTPIDDSSMSDIAGTDSEAIANMSPRALAKQLNIGNTAQLERRIKRELEEQGILEADERPEDNPDDEILSELRRKQQELKAIGQHNLVVTKRLYKLAKEEMSKQDLRKKLAAVDAEIMEAYRKVQSTRIKKKTPTKKEKDAMWRAIKEREQILKILNT